MSAADIVFRIDESDAGKRLDKVVLEKLSAMGRRGVARLFRDGQIRVEGRLAKKGEPARARQEVFISFAAVEPIRGESESPLDVRLETEHVLVVRKRAGQPTAPLRPGETGTLAGALLGHYPELAGVGHRAREPGLVHRLDTQTSGLLVVARAPDAFERLSLALSDGLLVKRYVAIVEAAGLAESGIVVGALSSDPGDPRRVLVAGPDAPKPRRTEWRKVRAGSRFALLEITAKKAYRHQVRAHLASVGHPIAGDRTYGGAALAELGDRHALHASYVAWAGDDRVPGFAVEDELPADLVALVDA